jgi:acyl-CoA reductase-like NAD-dependent aldehyde dehydrogenase
MSALQNTKSTVKSFENWVDGEASPAQSGRRFERINPFDGTIASSFANGDEREVELAISAARRAFDDGPWVTTAARTRFQILSRTAELVTQHAAQLAERMVLESGKPVTVAQGEVLGSVKTLQYYAGTALAMEGQAISDRVRDALGLVLHEPIGVAALITPWNYPLLSAVCKIAPALAAGCTIIAKPSHLCPGPVLLLAELLAEAGLPKGVFNAVTSDVERGAVVGQALASSHRVDKVAFTGSTAAGRAVMRAAAANNKRVSLELGGKSANIVFDDAPFEAAAATAIKAFCFNSGQQCSAGTRLLVQRGIHERFLSAVIDNASREILGDPCDPRTTMGPLVNEEQFKRVCEYVELGRSEGNLVLGGARPTTAKPADGFFVEPTIFDHIENSARLAQEEVFGPVLSVIVFDTEEEAVRLANDSPFGLAGGVWTNSLDRAMRIVRGIRTGKVFVNCYNNAGLDDVPHGGYKDSGLGREFGKVGLEEYQQLKTVLIKFRV